MMFPYEKGQLALLEELPLPVPGELSLPVDQRVQEVQPARPPGAPLGLAPVDEMAACAFATGHDVNLTVEGLLDWVTASARSLVAADRDEARMRMLARDISIARVQVIMLQRMVGRSITLGKLDVAERLDRLLNSATRRLVRMLGEHRASCAMERRTAVVSVENAENVLIKAGR